MRDLPHFKLPEFNTAAYHSHQSDMIWPQNRPKRTTQNSSEQTQTSSEIPILHKPGNHAVHRDDSSLRNSIEQRTSVTREPPRAQVQVHQAIRHIHIVTQATPQNPAMNRLSQQGGGQLVTGFDQGSIHVRVPEVPTSPEPLGVAEKGNNPKRVLFEIDVPDRGTPGGGEMGLVWDGGESDSRMEERGQPLMAQRRSHETKAKAATRLDEDLCVRNKEY
ncbi:hypothetical protein EUGRSUZ_K02469 [Eucalyptus grandis]|uniref:Uncharacterized protein n=2 Tax=Eucalyptus grandis TaxID=71139 RepID=A0ACC3IWQ8_EUCGR|nr:hypothetical protein EUGRSUZ_K02469 [Eucalyptus grandis]